MTGSPDGAADGDGDADDSAGTADGADGAAGSTGTAVDGGTALVLDLGSSAPASQGHLSLQAEASAEPFALAWSVSDGTLTMEATAPASNVWVGLGWSVDGTMEGSLAAIGDSAGVSVYDLEMQFREAIYERTDGAISLAGAALSTEGDSTTLSFSMDLAALCNVPTLVSGGTQDAAVAALLLTGVSGDELPLHLLWAYGDTSDLAYHTRARRGQVQLTLLNALDACPALEAYAPGDDGRGGSDESGGCRPAPSWPWLLW